MPVPTIEWVGGIDGVARLIDQTLLPTETVFIDCGDIDQYNLVYGARRMHRSLTALGIDHVYEEFADNHSQVDRRMDVSLPILANALAG